MRKTWIIATAIGMAATVGCSKMIASNESLSLKERHRKVVEQAEAIFGNYNCIGRRYTPENDNVSNEVLGVLCVEKPVERNEPENKLFGWDDAERGPKVSASENEEKVVPPSDISSRSE